MDYIPFNDLRRVLAPIKDQLVAAIKDVVESGLFIHGPSCVMFERDVAALSQREHALGVASGTDALELALRACGVRQKDLVVMQANAGGYAAVATQAIGALAYFVDVNPGDGQMSLEQTLRIMDDDILAPRAVVVTHLYGRVHPHIQELEQHAKKRGVVLIEDCSHAHGAQLYGRAAGSFGTAACFSFYPTKNLGALGDAGAVVTNDDNIAREIRALRLYGWQPRHCISIPHGRNSRLDEMQAAVLHIRIRSLQLENFQRQVIAGYYCEHIRNSAISVPTKRGGPEDVVHLFYVLARKREELIFHLERQGIEASVRYPVPDHRCAGLENRVQGAPLERTERWSKEVLCLPCWPGMDDSEIKRVIEACNSFAPSP